MKKLVIDLDGTLTLDDEKDYAEKSVNLCQKFTLLCGLN